MDHKTKHQRQKPWLAQPAPTEEVTQQKVKAEEREVAGRHKHDGQKDHKGAR